jgi:hypothetical protein
VAAAMTLNSVSFGGITRGAKPLDILHGIRTSQIKWKKMVPMQELSLDTTISAFVSVSGDNRSLHEFWNRSPCFGATCSTHMVNSSERERDERLGMV